MSNGVVYTHGDGFNHDFTDEASTPNISCFKLKMMTHFCTKQDALMLVSIASSPEHRLHTCRWMDSAGRCGSDIQGGSYPQHFRERHGIIHMDARQMRCQWEGCMEFISAGNLFPHLQQKHLAWRYPCFNCGMEFPRKSMRNAHFMQCRANGN